MTKPEFPYYSFIHSKYKKSSNKETFYESENLDWAKLIESNYDLIKSEFLSFINNNQNQFESYFSSDLVSGVGKWKTIGFVFWGIRNYENCNACEKSIQLFSNIPGFISISISKMEGNSEILGHHGDSDAIYRCHLPLVVPGELPEIGFQVGKEQKAWKEGKLMIFNDAAYHKGWNKTSKERTVLMIDILKPQYIWQKKWICAFVFSSLVVQKVFKLNFKNKKNPLPYILLYPMTIYAWYYFALLHPKLLPTIEK